MNLIATMAQHQAESIQKGDFENHEEVVDTATKHFCKFPIFCIFSKKRISVFNVVPVAQKVYFYLLILSCVFFSHRNHVDCINKLFGENMKNRFSMIFG